MFPCASLQLYLSKEQTRAMHVSYSQGPVYKTYVSRVLQNGCKHQRHGHNCIRKCAPPGSTLTPFHLPHRSRPSDPNPSPSTTRPRRQALARRVVPGRHGLGPLALVSPGPLLQALQAGRLFFRKPTIDCTRKGHMHTYRLTHQGCTSAPTCRFCTCMRYMAVACSHPRHPPRSLWRTPAPA